MNERPGEFKTKGGGEKGNDYSVECVHNTCIITYKGKIKDRKILRFVPLISIFGETAVRFAGGISLLLSLSIFFVTLQGLTEKGLCSSVKICFLLATLFITCNLFFGGMFLHSYVKYVRATRCKKCRRIYAYKEREEPDVREVSTEDSYTVLITRYWKCKYCGYIDSSESSENIRTRKGKKEKAIQINCEKCGKTGVYPECKNPDIKEEKLMWNDSVTTIRYYRCGSCGHINLEVGKESYGYEQGIYSKKKGKDPRILN